LQKHFKKGTREMKTNHDGTVTLNAYDTWTSCGACGQRVTGDSIHTCSPQLKELTDEEITEVFDNTFKVRDFDDAFLKFARAILRKASEK
jgi:succinate dehydrogenase/fumarate reductase-like Fe-S protein